MKISELRLIRSALKDSVGPSWPLFLANCDMNAGAVFKSTYWASIPCEESEFLKRLAIVPTTYLKLAQRLGRDKALDVVGRFIVPASVNDMQYFLNSLNLAGSLGMTRLVAFWDAMYTHGIDRFMDVEVLEQGKDTYHVIFTRCVIHDFMQEVGTPELTHLFCESDHIFFQKAFPEFTFTRGDSWENTLAYGKKQCEYLLMDRHDSTKRFKNT